MSSSKTDPEVQVGAKLGFGKRCALISASVLLAVAGAVSYRHAVSAGVVAGVQQRQLQGRRLPHYTTYGGTSYDFHGGALQPFRPTNGVSGQVVNYNPTRPPMNFQGGFGRAEAKLQPCCCTKEAVEIPDGGFCTMEFEMELEEYNPTMPPMDYNPTMPPMGYNPTRPPMTLPGGPDKRDKLGAPEEEDDKPGAPEEDEEGETMTLEGTMTNSCCCNEKAVPWMSETCTVTTDDDL